MSLKLFRLFVKSLRQNLPKYPKTGRYFAHPHGPFVSAAIPLSFLLRFLFLAAKLAQIRCVSQSTIRFVAAMDVAQKDPEEPIVPSKNITRYKRRHMKRQWEDLRKDDGETTEKKLCDENGERIKRKKMAMLLGYCGVDYYGMQRNPGVRTIEEDLLKALLEAKYITEDDFKNQQNANFQRSSRTDKGVSAARQVVSLKLPLETNIDEINKRLPDCIRVFGVKRVTNKFNSKVKCNARTYSYTLPTYVFERNLETDGQKKQYRITSEKLELVTNALNVYKGTKSYHNFTEKKHYQDPSASRYMMGFNVEKLFIESEMEFAVLLVKGQSFMLHQIRKMVGLVIAIVRGHTDITILDKVFGKDKVMIPTAPGLGLVLDKVHYDRYDKKFKDTHDSLTWDDEEEAVQKFTRQHIYPNIVRGEIELNNMGLWLEKLKQHSYDPADATAEQIDEKETRLDDDDDDDATGHDEDDVTQKEHRKTITKKNNDEKVASEMTTNGTSTDSEVTKDNADTKLLDEDKQDEIIDKNTEDKSGNVN